MSDIDGIDPAQLAELQRKIDAIADVGASLAIPLRNGAELLRSEIATYPPETAANRRPSNPPGTYYVRGDGQIYVKKNGVEIKRKGSQDLGGSWSITYNLTRDQAEARIGNRASYAKYAHDERKQARWMKAIGWRTAQAQIKRLQGDIVGYIKRGIDAVIAR
jgi:hypothetical protein